MSACSVKGLCLATVSTGAASSSGSKVAAAVYVPPPDKTPPQLQLLGNGKAAITATGQLHLRTGAFQPYKLHKCNGVTLCVSVAMR